MAAAALLVALPQLALVACTMAWNSFLLLAPLVSSEPRIHRLLGKSTSSQRMTVVAANAALVVSCLAGLVVMMWSMSDANSRDLPVSAGELVIFCGVMLTMSCMVVFWALDLCSSIEEALELNIEPQAAESQPVLCNSTA